MIKISKKNEQGELIEYEYNSINSAAKENGATSGVNRQVGLRYLEKAGFDISTLVETKSTKRAKGIVEKLYKLCKEIDKGQIKELEKERLEKLKNAKTANDMEELVKYNEKIESLQNPTVTDRQLLEKLDELIEKWHDENDGKPENEKPFQLEK